MKSNTEEKQQARTHVAFVRRPLLAGQQKVAPVIDRESYEISPSTQASRTLSSVALEKNAPHLEPTKSLWTITKTKEAKKPAVAPSSSDTSSSESKSSNLTQKKESCVRIKRWYSGLTSKQKTLFRIGIVVGILLVFAILVLLLVVFLVILRTTTTTSTPTTTTSPTVISATWTFDMTANDFYGIYNGALMNGSSYSPNSTSQPYLGNGHALTLSATNYQSFIVSTPFLNLAYTSFTVQAWIYSTDTTNDHGIFSQCACSTCSNQCFSLIIRSGRLYADFTFNSLYGSTTIATSTWYHIVFVYNYDTRQQIWYINGNQDSIASNAQPYQGTNGSIQIGSAQIIFTKSYFTGYIDNVKLTTRAKSATEILSDASLTAYYSFDLSSLNNDDGPNGLNGSSVNTGVSKGRVNEAIYFTGSSSYFQTYGFYQFIYSVSSQPFSISLWINPSSVSTSTIAQITQLQTSGQCFNFMAITSPAGVTGQIMAQGFGCSWPVIYGPFITANTWTHISITYSYTNGMSMYVNGVLFGYSGSCGFSTNGFITWLQIGYIFYCAGDSVPNNGFKGSIDELYIHSRELTQADVTGLANP